MNGQRIEAQNFVLIPWQEDFLPALLRLALQDGGASLPEGVNLSDGSAKWSDKDDNLPCGGGNLDDVLFVFPHARPTRYLERLIRLTPAIAKPCLLPEMLPVHSLFEKIRAEKLSPAISIGLLDQVGLLLECVRAEQMPLMPFGDAKVFFPWGIRLANLFEDCFIHGIRPGNFPYLEGELAEYAVALLENLGNLYDRYVNALTERNLTTSGFTALQATEAFMKSDGKSRLTAGKRIYLAGFHSLNGCENKVFHKLWSAGARVVLHADPGLAGLPAALGMTGLSAAPQLPRSAAHWSCAELEKWRSRWKARWQIYPETGQAAAKPRITYYSGYDLHSQLAALQTIVEAESKAPAYNEHRTYADGALADHLHTTPGSDSLADHENMDAAFGKSGDLAIILPEADLLPPTLHHLRDHDLNISLGYPLDKAPLSRLLENLLALQENRRQGGYYWKDLLSLFRHPYVKMLASYTIGDTAAEKHSALWRDFLHRLEGRLRQGRRFTDASALLRETALSFEARDEQEAVTELADKLQKAMLDGWSGFARGSKNNKSSLDNQDDTSRRLSFDGWSGFARGSKNDSGKDGLDGKDGKGSRSSLNGLAAALDGLCALLLEKGEALWPRFPIDAECLYRLMRNVLPQLRLSAMSREELPQETLFAILRQLIAQERVPFDAYPLTAMQVLGLLESRLLHFRKVCILEATDNALPGGASSDPLLPDSLRLELGLPDSFRKQQMTAYYFFRLLHGAEEVHLFWQESTEPQGLQDAKKSRSRFVEELIWQEEQTLGRRLKPERPQAKQTTAQPGVLSDDIFPDDVLSDGPLRQLACAPGAVRQADREIKTDSGLAELLEKRLQNREKPVSASLLNTFITCPQAFYFGDLVGLRPLGEVAEDEDPGETGQLLHQVFADHYSDKLDRELRQEAQSRTELINTFRRNLEHSEIPAAFPQDALAGLRAITPLRLDDYLRNQPASTKILALEVSAEGVLDTPLGRFFLAGRIDRLDERVERGERDEEDGIDEIAEIDETPEKHTLILLDYKTGKTTPPVQGFWSDAALWADLERAVQIPEALSETEKEALLSKLADGLNNNIQLPFYLYLLHFGRLHGETSGQLAANPGELEKYTGGLNAAWIDLGFQGKEQPLFSDEYSATERTEIIERKIPLLLGFILTRLLKSADFKARRGSHCKYCAYAGLCTVHL
ncbi:MAG: PD-(D/E)XK nuclease family protein [Deltaproteobacteria bacterium]|jgi:hypothetical protein|nr:PD-(D/E)XK nuclease family protein [Deltaproteobacteria bacterium]